MGISETLKELLYMSQEEIMDKALNLPDATLLNEGTVFVRGTVPLVLVAHMDTVYPGEPEKIYEQGERLYTAKGGKIGIGGDDRCGCALLFEAAKLEFAPSLLFCSDEETCNGSSVGLNELDWSDYKAFIECDGPGYGVFYAGSDTSNKYLNDFLQNEIGLIKLATSYNDISEICEPGTPPGITLGAAYYNQHDESNEWISSFGMTVQLEVLKLIIKNLDHLDWSVVPEPTKKKKAYNYGGTYYNNTASTKTYGSSYYMDDDDYWYGKYDDDDDDTALGELIGDEEKFYKCSIAESCADCELYEICDDAVYTRAKEVGLSDDKNDMEIVLYTSK